MYSWYDMIQIMKSWIDENIEDIPPLSELTKRLGYSYFYSTKKFHEIERISFRQYISLQKIQYAALDIYQTNDRILDIAVKYGYSSQEAFTRAFVKVFGITPASYRRLQKPTSTAEKYPLLCHVGYTKFEGGNSMKINVKQMYDWNYYGYYAEDVEEKYWDYFKEELWWQVGNSFIKTYDNVKDFEYCAKNFTKHGEVAIKQCLKMIPAPWEKALELLVPEMRKLEIDWFVHGSVAMALWGIDVAPKDVNIIVPNYSDFEKVRNHFYKLAIKPFERCENWLMSGLGDIFLESVIGFAFHNKELEPYDMSKLGTVMFNGESIHVESLEGLKQGNEHYNRPERVKMIEEKINHAAN